MNKAVKQVLDELVMEYKSAVIKFKGEQERIAKEVMDPQALYFTNNFGAAYMLKIDQLQIAATQVKTLESVITTTAFNLYPMLDSKEREEYNAKVNAVRSLLAR